MKINYFISKYTSSGSPNLVPYSCVIVDYFGNILFFIWFIYANFFLLGGRETIEEALKGKFIIT